MMRDRAARAGPSAPRRWKCPSCDREFGRANQSHGCEPAQPLEVYFEGRPPALRRACDAILRRLEKLGPIRVEAVGVGILIKRSRTFAELRAKRDRLELGLLLSREIDHPRITKVIQTSARRHACFLQLRGAADVDGEVGAWLREAYEQSPV